MPIVRVATFLPILKAGKLDEIKSALAPTWEGLGKGSGGGTAFASPSTADQEPPWRLPLVY
jgi:hypothetical protein